MVRGSVCLILSVMIGTHAFAQPEQCASPMTHSGVNGDDSTDYAAQDTQLNDTYRQLLAKVSDPGKKMLRDAQRNWIAFRDKDCAFQTAGTLGGSIHSAMLSN